MKLKVLTILVVAACCWIPGEAAGEGRLPPGDRRLRIPLRCDGHCCGQQQGCILIGHWIESSVLDLLTAGILPMNPTCG